MILHLRMKYRLTYQLYDGSIRHRDEEHFQVIKLKKKIQTAKLGHIPYLE